MINDNLMENFMPIMTRINRIPDIVSRPHTDVNLSQIYSTPSPLEKLFDDFWESINRAPGNKKSSIEKIEGGYRLEYSNGYVYKNKNNLYFVYGAIHDKYESLGNARSWLGLPVSSELDFIENGRVTNFENGSIYWWPDTGAIELNEVVIHYTGLICFGETNWDMGSDADEPYVVLGVLSPSGNNSEKTQIYNDVDGGESRPDLIEIYRGKPYGVTISALLMERDYENPEVYKSTFTKAFNAATEKINDKIKDEISNIPAGGYESQIAKKTEDELKTAEAQLANFLYDALDLKDDKLGVFSRFLSAKEMIVMAAKMNNFYEKGVGFKFASDLMSRFGASYKVYFGIIPS